MGPSITSARRAIELGRPVVLFAVFLVAGERLGLWAAPFALVSVFAFTVLVHDLIHKRAPAAAVLATAFGVAASTSSATTVLTFASSAAVLGNGYLLDRGYAPPRRG